MADIWYGSFLPWHHANSTVAHSSLRYRRDFQFGVHSSNLRPGVENIYLLYSDTFIKYSSQQVTIVQEREKNSTAERRVLLPCTAILYEKVDLDETYTSLVRVIESGYNYTEACINKVHSFDPKRPPIWTTYYL